MTAAPVRRINHVILRVRDLDRSVAFYRAYFGFTEAFDRYGPGMAFLRAPQSDNPHDLALLQAEPDAPVGPTAHRASSTWSSRSTRPKRWRRPEIGSSPAASSIGEFDHGATKSVYGWDPDGSNIEVVWILPPERWGKWATRTPERLPLNLDAEIHAHLGRVD